MEQPAVLEPLVAGLAVGVLRVDRLAEQLPQVGVVPVPLFDRREGLLLDLSAGSGAAAAVAAGPARASGTAAAASTIPQFLVFKARPLFACTARNFRTT
ncbi:hypothetical protein [Saccharopolyspora gregorii]|uniref:Uncharacterized protein n=1 Tax=Saccharopolyspora gregorii TaxID=33914 RepID=A0ABP6RK08_9PSEU